MTYSQAIAYLYGLQRYGIKLGLDNIRRLLAAVGDPHQRFPSILIGGTNGKGSTAAFLSSILKAAGYRIGLYTSPHLLGFTERIQVDGRPIAETEVAAIVDELRPVIAYLFPTPGTPNPPVPPFCKGGVGGFHATHPTFFEVTTAMAFLHFVRSDVDYAVVEVGLGGRFDATNVLTPQVAVITNIALEHEDYLGKTLGAIAAEKAGIIKETTTRVVTAVDAPEALPVISDACRKRGVALVDVRSAYDWRIHRSDLFGQQFSAGEKGQPAERFDIPLLGRHQVVNAVVALAASRLLRSAGAAISERSIHDGLSRTRWPGRLQLLPGRPLVILDGAHNPAGARALRAFLEEQQFIGRLTLVFGVLQDKNWTAMLQELAPLATRVVLTRPESERAADPRHLQEAERICSKLEIVEDVAEAISLARAVTDPEEAVVVTGSLFVVSAALRALGTQEVRTGDDSSAQSIVRP
ncbi:MAG: bifunctional folylpolyglutamate synthase/dihydrofolate synthase [Candidatus Methylomirabilota bacterium]|nr:bifunctional folylpolyglutamate synthase/dihydrofolate synthase [Candidatus Methylomirabilis sp.]NJD67381.1 bifunctional folylpolyglutamate synthase/dihydrofolate synthase [candidate division NC10 bacterium]PWB45878.1 MAG: bifunctional folylpolyglutamate synthase/dihydrofolate synthase [candidate division NC10 bacterium]